MLSCEDVWLSLPGSTDVLKGVSIQVKPSEIVGLIGPNGSGKTTLILTLAGLLVPRRGKVILDGRDLQGQLPHARRRIGVVFQDPDDQLFNPSVIDELMFTLDQLGLTREEKESRVRDVASKLNLSHLLERPVFSLSFGEKRRVALASTLVYNPDYILLDEPTANLDPQNVNSFLKILCRLKEEGKGILLATQDVELARSLADVIYIIYDGKIVWSGEVMIPDDILERAGLVTRPYSCAEK